jgi:hypothetical protein
MNFVNIVYFKISSMPLISVATDGGQQIRCGHTDERESNWGLLWRIITVWVAAQLSANIA